jgi:hypothetical protein
MRLKGALHLHTTLSHDGKLSLDELVAFLKSRGYAFICITEHSYDIDKSDMESLTEKCLKMSSREFMIIPGIEFRCHDDIDILGYGVTEPIDSENPATVIAHIRKHHGVPVLAHPTVRDYPLERDWVVLLDGAELWNNQEGKFLPQARTFKRIWEFQSWQPSLKVFFGLDLHRPGPYFPIATVIESPENSRNEILKALADGRFTLDSPYLKLDSSGKIGIFVKAYIFIGSAILNMIRKLRG